MTSTSTPGKTRPGISEIQKKALRAWFFGQEPRPTHAACIDWFEGAYNRRLNQSTVSQILSKRYEHLDHGPASNGHRLRPSQWPLLERALSEWLEQKQEHGEHATGDDICAKARETWLSISEYQDMSPPQFSAGWLQRFRKRHSTRLSTGNDGVLPAAPLNARREYNGLRTICGEFPDDDVYSMDETALLWRRAPFDVLSPNEAPAMLNKDEARVCLVVCTNASGSDRIPLWVIGHKESPESLRGVNLDALDVKWRYNQKAWMNVHIMSEWLLFFYERVGTRRVLLLLDDFYAHEVAVESTPPPPNVHLQFFPAYGTTVQPLSLGITQHIKHHYRKRYLAYIAAGFDTGQCPIQTMSLYHMFCWITRNWRSDLTNGTIYKAFRRSTLIETQLGYLSAPRLPDMTQLYNTVIQHNRSGRPPLTLEQFADPVAEDWNEQSNETAWLLSSTDTSALDEAEIALPSHELMPSTMAAITGVQTAIRYLLHQASTTSKDISDLERIERILNRYAMNAQNTQTAPLVPNITNSQPGPAPQTPQALQSAQATPNAHNTSTASAMQDSRYFQPMQYMQIRFKMPKTQATMRARNAPSTSSMQNMRPRQYVLVPQNPPSSVNAQNPQIAQDVQRTPSMQDLRPRQNPPGLQSLSTLENAQNAQIAPDVQSVRSSQSPESSESPETYQSPLE